MEALAGPPACPRCCGADWAPLSCSSGKGSEVKVKLVAGDPDLDPQGVLSCPAGPDLPAGPSVIAGLSWSSSCLHTLNHDLQKIKFHYEVT